MNNNYVEQARMAQYNPNFIIPAYFNQEQWSDILELHVPGVRECYMISTFGRVYNKQTGLLCKPRIASSNVLLVRLNKKEPCKDINVSLARTMLLVFKPIENASEMQAWYKDNNPFNLHIDNLYWATRSYVHNIRRNNINHDISNEDMRVAQYRPSNNIIVPMYHEDEYWTEVTDYAVPGIQPWYMISTYGRVFSKLTGYLMNTQIINSGYERVQFRSVNNEKLDALVHRVMMLCFHPIENKDEMAVNHKDEIRTHNHIDNLEWVTYTENNLYSLDEKYKNISRHTIHQICKGIEQGLTPQEISLQVLHEPYDERLDGLIRRIKTKRNWTDISDLYNF